MTMDDAAQIAGLLLRNGVRAEVRPFVAAEKEWRVWLPDHDRHLVQPQDVWPLLRAAQRR